MLLLFIVLLIVFSIPAVQTSLAKRLTNSINENNNVAVSIGKIGLTYTGKVNMEDVLINDHHKDTLIFVKEITSSVLSFTSLADASPALGNTVMQGLQMDMKIYKGENRDNLSVFVRKFKKKRNKKQKHPFHLSAGGVEIYNSAFSYIDENNNHPDVVVLDELNILGKDLLIDGTDVSINVKNMSGFEKRGVEIKLLSTLFSYTPEALKLVDLKLRTPESSIDSQLELNIEKGFGNFVNQVAIHAVFENASVATNDLQTFYDEFGANQELNFSTDFEGTLNNFKLDDFDFYGLKHSRVDADLIVQNLFPTEDDKFFSIQGDLRDLASSYNDLVHLLPNLLGGKLPTGLRKVGTLRAQGYAVLTASSIDADVKLASQLGTAQAKMMIGNFHNADNATYKGSLKVQDFAVGKLLEVQSLGKTSFNLNFDGKGFTSESLNTEVRGAISKLSFKGYAYHGIQVKGTLKAPLFNGNLLSRDPNFQFEFNGLADFSKNTNIYDFEANVHYADLSAMNFNSRDSLSVFQGDILMNMTGTNLNDATGEILLLNTVYKNDADRYAFDDLKITSSFEGPVRSIQVFSPDVISGKMEGVFDILELPPLFQNALGSLYTNYQPNRLTDNQYLDFDFDIYNKIVEVFYPKIQLAPNTFIRGSVESDESEFRLAFKSPEIKAFGNQLENVNIQVDNTNPLFNTYVEIDSVASQVYPMSDFNLINVTMNDTLFVRSEFHGGKRNEDVFNLNLYHTINKNNNSVVGIQKSDITFKDNMWYLNEFNNKSNRVILSEGFKDIRIDSLVLSHEKELISLNGQLKDSTYKQIEMQFDQVDLGKITPDIDSLTMGGLVNGHLNLLQRKGAYYPNSSLDIDSLRINEVLLGDLKMDVMGNKDLSLYNINTSITRDGFRSLSAIGEIVVTDPVPIINMDVSLQDLNLEAFSPLGGKTINRMRGLVSGNADVTGNYKNPDISGTLDLKNAGLGIPYLNVDYDFGDHATVNLSQQQFHFDAISLTDTKYDTKGVLNGIISHKNFKKWRLGLNISTDKLLVLNTKKEEESLYYGTAFISGSASIYGPTEELVIDVIAKTEPGTVFKIPINDSEAVGDNSYIHFLSPQEKEAILAGKEIELKEVKGLELNFDLDVTSDALVEINMDGSILRGRGAGTLLIEINTLGKFKMWGDFIANTGEYIFNYGALQKRFDVRPGGSINWNGNPAEADLNMSAVYQANANPAVILENPSISRRIPVNVVINLEGELLKPNFSFNLEYPNAASAVRSELEYKIETTANTEIQAFSLITLGQFYTDNVLASSSGGAVAGNIFQSASGFFNSLFSDDSGVFEVGLNYEQGSRTPEQSTADRFGVTLSTQISERVLINGQVGVPVGGVTETVVVGNIEIEFLLNEEGNLRAKIFNRENNIQYIGEELGFTQGIGLTYQLDFDTFRELIRKIVDLEIKKSEDDEQPTEKHKSLAPEYIRFPGTEED